MPAPEFRGSARDRLTRIGHLFLSEDRRQLRFTLLARDEQQETLRAIDLARALTRLGKTVAVLEPDQAMIQQIRMLPDTDSFYVTGNAGEPPGRQERPSSYAGATGDAEIMIIASAPAANARTTPFVLLAVPADATGMRRAWLDLKALAGNGVPDANPAAIGVTIVNAGTLEEAEAGFGKFAGAAQRFLGLELVSYACLTRDGLDREPQLRNIAALLFAELQSGVQANVQDIPQGEYR